MNSIRRAATVLAMLVLGSCVAVAHAQTRPAPSSRAPARTPSPGTATAPAQPPGSPPVAGPSSRRTAQPPAGAKQPARANQMPANGNGVRPAAHEEQPGAAAPQAVAGQQPPAVPGPQMELAPFALTPQQQQLVDQILAKWEKESERVGTFVCDFTRWEIDPVFGPKENEYLITEANGTIKYKSPDRGEYDVAKLTRWDKQKAGYVSDEIGCERWMCDGKAIYEWDRKNKLLKVRMLPDDLKGKSIADGPLPFVFGAKAEQLKRRYWLRDITPQQLIGKQIWLDARPKFQQDAANFQRATVVLNEKTFLPEALQLFPPGIAPAPGKPEAYTAFGFRPPSVNNPLDQLQFLPPITLPLLWKRVVVEDPSKQPDNPLPPAGEPAQAQRPAAPASRK